MGPFDTYPATTVDAIGEYAVPVDPMDDQQSDSCQ